MRRRILRRLGLGVLAFLALSVLLLAGTHEGRVLARTAALVTEVLPGVPVRPLQWLSPPAVRETVAFSYGKTEARAEVYRPRGPGRYPAFILLTGVTPNLEDPDLRRLLEGLARSGLVALLPHSAHMLQGGVTTEDVEAAIGAFRFLRQQDYVQPERIGLAGFSVGASVLALAAADERIRDQVAVLNFFGGYYDAADYVTEVVVNSVTYEGATRPWSTRPHYVPIIMSLVISTLERPEDRAPLHRAFVKGEQAPAEEWARRSPEGWRVYEFLANREPSRAQALRERLPPSTQQALRALSPSQVADRLKTRVFIMHDTNDPVIPYEESRRLRDRLATLMPPDQYAYTEFSIFEHMNPRRPLDPIAFTREAGKLLGHLYRVMLTVM